MSGAEKIFWGFVLAGFAAMLCVTLVDIFIGGRELSRLGKGECIRCGRKTKSPCGCVTKPSSLDNPDLWVAVTFSAITVASIVLGFTYAWGWFIAAGIIGVLALAAILSVALHSGDSGGGPSGSCGWPYTPLGW